MTVGAYRGDRSRSAIDGRDRSRIDSPTICPIEEKRIASKSRCLCIHTSANEHSGDEASSTDLRYLHYVQRIRRREKEFMISPERIVSCNAAAQKLENGKMKRKTVECIWARRQTADCPPDRRSSTHILLPVKERKVASIGFGGRQGDFGRSLGAGLEGSVR